MSRSGQLSYQVLQDWANLGIGSTILPFRKIDSNSRNRTQPLLSMDGSEIRAKQSINPRCPKNIGRTVTPLKTQSLRPPV